MSNYYIENRKFLTDLLKLQEIVKDLENDYKNTDASALHSFEEARQYYKMILENAGDICANFVEPRAQAIDETGASFNNGNVEWTEGSKENMNILAEAGFLGGILERKYGGLNLPVSINNVIVEMVSQADAHLMNLFGLQDIGMTIEKFGSQEQKDRVLPKFCSGEISGSMALTEPDAGSDLQAVQLRAIEKDGQWYLDGVKRFITNGSGEVSLVLARSEAGSKGGRGLSMFLYERYRDDNMIVRRIEDKLGIHGSPTCEMQFNMAKAELMGKRRFGLVKYIMSLMNGARLAVSSQALGIAQAAYEAALNYANEREQFGEKIVHFPALYQMLKKMEAEIETSRILLYDTALQVDYMDMYERKLKKGEKVNSELKAAKTLSDFLTPLSKFVSTEMANKVTYDAIQIHGGCGYMKDFPVERLARDARITNIYEGTTQMQVVAAMSGLKSNVLDNKWDEFEKLEVESLVHKKGQILGYIQDYKNIFEKIKSVNCKDFTDYTANYLLEIVSIIYRLVLFLPIAEKYQEKRELFKFYLNESDCRITYLINKIEKLIEHYGENIEDLKSDLVT